MASTSTISNTITDPHGGVVASVPVTVTLMPTAGFRVDDATEVARVVSTTTDASGVWSLTLERNSNITPSSTYYQVTEFIPPSSGGTRTWNIQVGASDQTVSAALVTPLPAAQASGFLTQASADARYQALGSLGSTSPTTSAVADAAAAGTSTAASRSDHKHGREAFATPVATASSGNAAGSATTVAHSDHVHQGTGTLAGGYAPVTVNQASITSTVDLTGLTATVTVGSGRRIRITASCEMTNNTADTVSAVLINEGATQLKGYDVQVRLASNNVGVYFAVVLTPTAGSHTYKLRALAGSGTATMLASATNPAYILVEDIGV